VDSVPVRCDRSEPFCHDGVPGFSRDARAEKIMRTAYLRLRSSGHDGDGSASDPSADRYHGQPEQYRTKEPKRDLQPLAQRRQGPIRFAQQCGGRPRAEADRSGSR